jgi:hypothetical protein
MRAETVNHSKCIIAGLQQISDNWLVSHN